MSKALQVMLTVVVRVLMVLIAMLGIGIFVVQPMDWWHLAVGVMCGTTVVLYLHIFEGVGGYE